MKNQRACKDCLAALPDAIQAHPNIKGLRPAPFPGPRCHTHHRAWTNANRQKAHRKRVAQNFGLGEGGYDKLLKIQGGACGGCGVIPGPRAKRLAVDHDHTCCPGKESCGRCVRGLLCHGCNDDLARVRDNPAKLRGLADYLEHWPSRDLWVYESRTPSVAEMLMYREASASVRLDGETHVLIDNPTEEKK